MMIHTVFILSSWLIVVSQALCENGRGFGEFARALGSSNGMSRHTRRFFGLRELVGNSGSQCTCQKPPTPCSPFPVEALSQMRPITPMCIQRASIETRNLIEYLEKLLQKMACTNVAQGLEEIRNAAQAYSIVFGQNVRQVQSKGASCARSILRANEAILTALSSLALVAPMLDHNLKMNAPCNCMSHNEASRLIVRTARTYVRLMSVLMSKTMNHLSSAERIAVNDPILQLADDIALITIQLAPSSAQLFKTSGNCYGPQFHTSINAFQDNLKTMEDVTESLDKCTSKKLKTCLAVVEHNMIVMAFDTKLNATDNAGGFRRLDNAHMDLVYEISRVFRAKNQYFLDIMERYENVLSGSLPKDQSRETLTRAILGDVQLIEVASKQMSKNKCARKLILDTNLVTESMLRHAAEISIGDQWVQILFDVIATTTDVSTRIMSMLDFEKAEDIPADSGFDEVLKAWTEMKDAHLLPFLHFARGIKAIVEIPTCFGKDKSMRNFTKFRLLMRTFASTFRKLPPILMAYSNHDAEWNALVDEAEKAVKLSWNIVYGKRVRSHADHECFVLEYSKQMFELLSAGLSRLSVTSAKDAASLKLVKNLLTADRTLMDVLANAPNEITKIDKENIAMVHRVGQQLLSNPDVYKFSAVEKINAMLSKVSGHVSENHSALTALLNAILAVKDIQ